MIDLIPELDQLAGDVMRDWQVPGAAIAVVRPGEAALIRAYGQRNVEANLPVTAQTQFVICSLTKSFTATAIALLHAEDRLDWTKPVRNYLPAFRLYDPIATEQVTIQDLLCHRTGLPRHDWMISPCDLGAAELLDLMRYLAPSRNVRAEYQYNNLCYNAAGLLIERVTGQSYADFLNARLTGRLGMALGVTLEELEASQHGATPYQMHMDERAPAQRLPIRTIAAGAINLSIADTVPWMQLHLNKGKYEGKNLLPAALMDELHAPRVYCGPTSDPAFGDSHYGLGFGASFYRGDRILTHSGGWTGWSTLMTLLPEHGIGVAVFTNLSANQVPSALTWFVIDRLRNREPINWRDRFREQREAFLARQAEDKEARETARHKNAQHAHALADYAAEYAHPAYGVMSISVRDGALHWAWRGMFAVMTHRHYETFELPEAVERILPSNLTITFLTDRDGNIISLSAPLEPMVNEIVFSRVASGDCIDAAFLARCAGQFKGGATAFFVTLDGEDQLTLKLENGPVYRLLPEQGRRFQLAKLQGFFVEFNGDDEVPDKLVFHQPNGTFVAKRVAKPESETA